MHKRYMVIVLAISLVIIMTGCANAGQTGPTPSPIVIEPTPAPTYNGEPAKPTGTFVKVKDYSDYDGETPIVFADNFTIKLPQGSKYYIAKDAGLLWIYYDKIIFGIVQNDHPVDIQDLPISIFGENASKGTADYNMNHFMFLKYTLKNNEVRYEYYYKVNTASYLIGFDTPKGTDISKDIADILGAITPLPPPPNMTEHHSPSPALNPSTDETMDDYLRHFFPDDKEPIQSATP